MFAWILGCAAAMAVIVLAVKMIFLYKDLAEISRQFQERLKEDTNNVIYVSGNDRYIKSFAEEINEALGILYDRRRRYQNGDRELKEAVTNISHDLRTPLTAIYGYLELLEAESKSESVERYLVQIRNRTDAMRVLTEELFRYSVILSVTRTGTESQKPAVDTGLASDKERVVLNHFLADCLLSYYDIFRQNRIEPEVRIAEEEVVRFLDTRALRRIFCNILDNAVKYSKPVPCSDGTRMAQAVLSVEMLSDGTITFRNSAQNLDWVSVERLFDRFYTVETGRNATGLGLSIAKLLTERMGGSISAAYTDGMLEIGLYGL